MFSLPYLTIYLLGKMIIFPYPRLYETKSIKYIVCLMHANICPHAFMITGIHPLINHVEFHKSCGNTNCEIPHDYSHKRICVHYVYMIAGIHPLLNHAITHDSLMYTKHTFYSNRFQKHY